MVVLFLRSFDFFFFKQKTAYEMRISDWSSDVCSSDLRSRSRRSLVELGMADSSAGQEFGGHQHQRHHRTQALLVVVPLEVIAGPAVAVGDDVAGGAVLAHDVDPPLAPRGQLAAPAPSPDLAQARPRPPRPPAPRCLPAPHPCP